jgi:hypothetical protein
MKTLKLTPKQTAVITKNIENNKAIMKQINANIYTSVEGFIQNATAYINAINERRMCNVIKSVSSSGMSRVLKFQSFEIYKEKDNQNGKGYFRNYYTLFKQLGYQETKEGFRVNGCGMDMIFHTNYSIIHDLHRLGFINEADCRKLAQLTPNTL